MPSAIKRYTSNPSHVLLATQLFSTISFAVLNSTLVLYMTMKLHIHELDANALMGLFVAFNFGLHLLGGYIGGRLLSYRNLFILGMFLQMVACLVIAMQSVTSLYWGLALFLTGSGLNVPCINMMLTQQFAPESTDRETAFIWNYAGMNVGFFIGFTMAGYFQLQFNFYTLFTLAAAANLIAFFLLFSGWSAVADHKTPLIKFSSGDKSILLKYGIWGIIVVFALVVVLFFLLRNAKTTNILILAVSGAIFILFFILAFQQKIKDPRNKLFAFIILSIGGLVFWSLYQLAPMGLTLYAQYNVDRNVLGITIPPQWIGNINTIILAFGGLILPPLLKRIRKRYTFGLPMQFALSLAFIALGFFALPIGIALAEANGLSNFSWITVSYIFQSIGELFIGPIGYAMIGLLATENLQGLMMGSWMMLVGGTSGVIASYLSNYAIHSATSTSPLITNPGYSRLFMMIASAAAITAIILFLLIPFIRKLIGERAVKLEI